MTTAPLILLIEDELPIRRFLRASLAAEEYRLVEAETGAQALRLAKELSPGLPFRGSNNVFFKQRDDFTGDRFAMLSSPLAKRFVQIIGDILNVKSCHR